ncbi:hypothetical protein M9Y10_038607 [Tritrichomonas musculus]|uniref:Uncharacterized protein n=1 Tax=Tritrichomonas musculus TaxID=1915356 RepID=A0ABR2K8V6_9EUKA
MTTHDSMIKLMENLKNGSYPFVVKSGKNKSYVLKFRSSKAIFCLVLSILSLIIFLLCLILYDYKSKINTLFLLPFVVFFVIAAQTGIFHKLTIFYINDSQSYKWKYKKRFFFKKKLVDKADLSKLYIKINKMKGYKKELRYYLVIGGNGIDPIPISSATYNLDLIRSIGQKMSAISLPIKLNFFDVEDFPSYHQIEYKPS